MTPQTAVAERVGLTRASYFIIFGCFTTITCPSEPIEVPEWFTLGDDLMADMEYPHQMPSWGYNDCGSPSGSHLGRPEMKHVDFRRLAEHSFQTGVWFDTATPRQGVQQHAMNRSRRKDQRKGKGKGQRQG